MGDPEPSIDIYSKMWNIIRYGLMSWEPRQDVLEPAGGEGDPKKPPERGNS